jgi:hypothetical protein
MALSAGFVVHRAKRGLMMELDRQPQIGIPGITDIPPGWKRELGKWLLAVAAISLAVWISRIIGQIIFGAAIGLMWPVP